VTVFYCLRFETSLFLASYYSPDHGGGIRPRLNMGVFLQALDPLYIASGRSPQQKRFPSNFSVVIEVLIWLLHRSGIFSIVVFMFVSAGTYLPSCCLAINVYSGSVIPVFRRHVTRHMLEWRYISTILQLNTKMEVRGQVQSSVSLKGLTFNTNDHE
jgi:hypothetical protein